ncbi:MAG: hypothetical protein QM737_02695 [Ferruginibacter sp.]
MNLLETNLLGLISNEVLIALVSSSVTVVTGYIVLRERLLKTEMKLENVYDYIDNRNTITDNKLKAIEDDLQDMKELHKDASKSLAENTVAINELRVVLKMVTEKLQ